MDANHKKGKFTRLKLIIYGYPAEMNLPFSVQALNWGIYLIVYQTQSFLHCEQVTASAQNTLLGLRTLRPEKVHGAKSSHLNIRRVQPWLPVIPGDT